MKKIVLMLALMMATMTVAANNILYFTYSQAARTVACLNSQNELMIYCGYENELPTYVLINEVWAEQISSSFYEIWLYGYDAYTGEEIYMPIDLECIYLMQNRNIYSAAQYLRFKYTHSRPTFVWVMPPYNPFVRVARPVTYYYTYHYDIHRPGWHWRHYPHIHYHPYYRRIPGHPAPIPPKPYTPGKEYPGWHETTNGYQYNDLPLVGRVTAPRSASTVQNNPTGRNGNRITGNRQNNTITVTDRTTGRGTTSAAPSRTGVVSEGNTRGNNVSNRGSNSSTGREGTATRSDDNNKRGNSSTSRTEDNKRGNTNANPSRSSNAEPTRGTSTSRSSNAEPTRGTSTSRSDNSNNRVSTPSTNTERGNATTGRSSSTSSRSGNVSDNSRKSSSAAPATRSSDSKSSSTSRSGNASRSSSSRTSGINTSSQDNNSRGTTRGTQSSSRGTSSRTQR